MRKPRTPSLTPLAALVLAVSLAGCGGDVEDAGADGADGSPSEAASSPTERPSRTASPQEEGATLSLAIDGGEITPMGEKIEMSAGDTLTVRVTSDRAGELHVHASPEQYVEFEQGRSRHRLTLDRPGQVDIEEHDSGAVIARVLVR